MDKYRSVVSLEKKENNNNNKTICKVENLCAYLPCDAEKNCRKTFAQK